MEMKEDLYKILSVANNATDEEIKKAYHTLVLEYHPDKNPNNKEASEKFIKIKNAYDILSNSIKRTEYDNSLKNNNYKDIFQDEFREFYRKNAKYNSTWGDVFNDTYENRKGADTNIELTITIEDAYYGCSKNIRLGYNRNTVINIERGIKTGMKIILKGFGQNGNIIENNGDLIVTVKVLEDPSYFIDNHGLHVIKELDSIDAILGVKANVKIFDIDISYTIPPGTQNGRVLRIKGKGFPIYKKLNEYSDLLINILLTTPQDLDSENLEMLIKIRNNRNEKA